MRIVILEEFPDDYPMECCICMENFVGTEIIVETECNHVFHKQCCREWLRQARTCPVCRMDIPSTLENLEDPNGNNGQRQQRHGPSPSLGFGPTTRAFNRNDFHHEVVNLLQILRRRDRQLRSRRTAEVNRRSEVVQGSNPEAEIRNGVTTTSRNQTSVPGSLEAVPTSET